jgi:ribonuclease VapC
MIIDTSAVIAILKDEPEATAIANSLLQQLCRMSAVSYVEAAVIVDSNKNPVLSRRLDDLLRDVPIRLESVTPEQAEIAREAYRDFGKGRHKAGLNFGDCFAYALARATSEPLLFKGDDFRHTDVEVVEF